MRLQPTGLTPRVRQLAADFKRDIALDLGPLSFEMSAAEALDLADRLVDAAETAPK